MTEAPKRNYSSSFRASSLLPIHQKLPGISAFFITRVNICHANKARGYFSPLRNRICNDTGFLMSPTQYNMYLNADERLPVRPRLHRQKSRGGGKGSCCGAWGSRSLASCGLNLGEVLREEGNLQDPAHPQAGAHFLRSRLEHGRAVESALGSHRANSQALPCGFCICALNIYRTDDGQVGSLGWVLKAVVLNLPNTATL